MPMPFKPHFNSSRMATILGMSRSQMSTALANPDDPPPVMAKEGRGFIMDAPAVVKWWYKWKRSQEIVGSTGQDTANVVDFHAEKTRLTTAQADKIELSNLQLQGKLADMVVLAETLSNAMSIVKAGLDSIPAELKRKCPHLDQATVDEIVTIITIIRNSLEGDAVTLPDAVQVFEEDTA